MALTEERSKEITDDTKRNEKNSNTLADLYLALIDKVLLRVEEKKTTKEI